MPSIKTLTPILAGSYYHIFNRGTNRQNIFYTSANYDYFLNLLHKFLSDYVHFLAYALLPNHFHLVLKIKTELFIEERGNRSLIEENGSLKSVTDEEQIGREVVRQLKRMFITYAMAINKQENRSGNLFDPKYKRLEICDQSYLEYAIFYTHFNPEKHGISNNFRNYKYSSYKAILGNSKTKMDRKLVLDLFGGKESFVDYHQGWHEERKEITLE
ncbi:transposase [Maribellus sp. CM-23]|uniref:transposase n=1 Tax=Maribellus sp. CM-23 TaxID=2781026 RepID=UPI001F1A0764|nr:transposase [Maribellus sp. CM-23]MCE4565738.1 transposase [Maribellus sp. CM-23]